MVYGGSVFIREAVAESRRPPISLETLFQVIRVAGATSSDRLRSESAETRLLIDGRDGRAFLKGQLRRPGALPRLRFAAA
jgi:hypothetical protein